MSTLEKALGAAAAAISVLGAVLTVLGITEVGIVATVLVVLYGLFLLAQLLREARRQKRSTELLREAVQLSREAISEARLDGIHARNDIVGSTRKVRAELRDQSRRSNRRDMNLNLAVAALGGRISAESASMGTAITAHITKEARGTRGVARELSGSASSRLIQAEELFTAQLEARTRQVRRQAVTERTTIIAEIAKNEARQKDSLDSAMDGLKLDQQVTAQKLIAQLDGLRHVMDMVRRAVADLDASASATGASVKDVDQGVGWLINNARLLSEQVHGVEQVINLLTDNARGLSEQVLGLDQRIAGVVTRTIRQPVPPMVEVGERMGALRERKGEATEVQDIDIEVTVAAHKEALDRLRETLQEVRRSETLPEDVRRRMLRTLYAQLGMQDVKQEFVLDVNTYDVGVSFRAQMVRLMHLKERLSAQGYGLSPRENDKMRDRAFAEALGVPTPRLLFRDVPTGEVTLEPNSIIKPTVGESSRGVFYVRPDLNLESLKTRNVYSSFEEAAAEYDRWPGASTDPRWISEGAVLDREGKPARNIKVFMFYGKVGLFREVLRLQDNDSGPLTAAYDETGRRIAYRANDDPDQDSGIPDGVEELATILSLASPVPFLRVDFLVGADGPVLGEVTPHPGGIYAGDAYDEVDRRLGRMFLEADARLTIDLLHGKMFGDYFSAYNVNQAR